MFGAFLAAATAAANAMNQQVDGDQPEQKGVIANKVSTEAGIPGIANTVKDVGSKIGAFGQGVRDIAGPFQDLYSMTSGGAKRSGKQAGFAQRAFMDAAYPGSTPWERLGTGQGGAASGLGDRSQLLQDRMQKRTLSMNKYVADKNALAAIAPKLIETYPKLAVPLLKMVHPTSSVGGNLGTALQEREYELRGRETAVKEKDAITKRLMYGVSKGQLEVQGKRLKVEIGRYVNELYSSMTGTMWRAFINAVQSLGRDIGDDETYLKAVLDEYTKITGKEPPPPPGGLVKNWTSGAPKHGRLPPRMRQNRDR